MAIGGIDKGLPTDAELVTYDNTVSGLTATNTQDAIDEVSGGGGGGCVPTALFDANTILKADVDDTPLALTIGASQFLGRKSTGSIAALTVAETKTELNYAASEIDNTPAGNIAATDVQAAINELDGDVTSLVTGVSSVFGRAGVVAATSGDYTGSQITNTPAGSIAATDTQAAINELDGDITALVTGVSSVHARAGAVVSANGDYTASEITNVPAGDIAAVTVQAALNELDDVTSPLNDTNGVAFWDGTALQTHPNFTFTGTLGNLNIAADAGIVSNGGRWAHAREAVDHTDVSISRQIGFSEIDVSGGPYSGTIIDSIRGALYIASDVTGNAGTNSITIAPDGGGNIRGNSVIDVDDGVLGMIELGTGANEWQVLFNSMAQQSATGVAITGGTIAGITDLAVDDGGTGSSTASGARTNLGLVIGTDIQPAGGKTLRKTAVSISTNVSDEVIGVTDTSALRTITLSDVTAAEGSTTFARYIMVKDESGNAGTGGFGIDVTPESGTIDGVASISINVDSGKLKAYSDGTNWFTD